MKGERIKDVIESRADAAEWPTYFVVTDTGVHEYTGQTFVRRPSVPPGRSIEAIAGCLNRTIQEVRGDGESAVILLENMDVIVFDLAHDVYASPPQSWPSVRCVSAAEAQSWKDEYDAMDLLF